MTSIESIDAEIEVLKRRIHDLEQARTILAQSNPVPLLSPNDCNPTDSPGLIIRALGLSWSLERIDAAVKHVPQAMLQLPNKPALAVRLRAAGVDGRRAAKFLGTTRQRYIQHLNQGTEMLRVLLAECPSEAK